MDSKVVRRTLKKAFNVNSPEELVAELNRIHLENPQTNALQAFCKGLMEALDTFDRAIVDLSKMIDIRDRGLMISSSEMTAMNNEIAAQAKNQTEVLNQLQTTMRLLLADRGETTNPSENNLAKLVADVSTLVTNQLNASRDLKALFDEGIRISSAMTYSSLEDQVHASVEKLTGLKVGLQMFFAGGLLGDDDSSSFFTCHTSGKAQDRLEPDSMSPSAHVQYQTLSSTKDTGILAFMKFEFPESTDAVATMARIKPLLPNIGSTLENIKLMQDERHKLHLESELSTARFVQQALLPPPGQILINNQLEISGYYQSASECGGDWWSWIAMADGRQIIFVGDVTGHGTGSAMISAMVKGYCESFVALPDLSVGEMLEHLNKLIHTVNPATARAMTMAAISIDAKMENVTFANAGHPAPIMLKDAAKSTPTTLKYLTNVGPILGISGTARFREKTYRLDQGDQLVLYSDGILEYISRNQEFYGNQRLERLLASINQDLSAEEVNHAIIQDLRAFSLGQAPTDDITSVVVKRRVVHHLHA